MPGEHPVPGSTAQHSAAQHSAAQHSAAQRSTDSSIPAHPSTPVSSILPAVASRAPYWSQAAARSPPLPAPLTPLDPRSQPDPPPPLPCHPHRELLQHFDSSLSLSDEEVVSPKASMLGSGMPLSRRNSLESRSRHGTSRRNSLDRGQRSLPRPQELFLMDE
jgi:hypothetical protein